MLRQRKESYWQTSQARRPLIQADGFEHILSLLGRHSSILEDATSNRFCLWLSVFQFRFSYGVYMMASANILSEDQLQDPLGDPNPYILNPLNKMVRYLHRT